MLTHASWSFKMVLFEWFYFLLFVASVYTGKPLDFLLLFYEHFIPCLRSSLAFFGSRASSSVDIYFTKVIVRSFLFALHFFCCMAANTLSPHLCLSQVWILAVVHSRQRQLTKSLRKLVFHPVKEVLCQGKVVKACSNSGNKMRNVTVQWIKLCILFCCVTWWKVMVWVFVYLKKKQKTVETLVTFENICTRAKYCFAAVVSLV